jgi:hypothetical protein
MRYSSGSLIGLRYRLGQYDILAINITPSHHIKLYNIPYTADLNRKFVFIEILYLARLNK